MKTAQKPGSLRDAGTLKAATPRYIDGFFIVDMQLRANKVLRPKDVEAVSKAASELFRSLLYLNNITGFAWPPAKLDVIPHGDFCGLELTIGTLCQQPKLSLDTAAGRIQ